MQHRAPLLLSVRACLRPLDKAMRTNLSLQLLTLIFCLHGTRTCRFYKVSRTTARPHGSGFYTFTIDSAAATGSRTRDAVFIPRSSASRRTRRATP